MTLKDVQALILWTCEYLTSHSQEDCAEVIKLRIEVGRLSWIIPVVTLILIRGGGRIRGGEVTREADGHRVGGLGVVRREGSQETGRCYAAGFEDGRGREPRTAGSSRSWERLGVGSPLESPERNQPSSHLDSDLQN